MISRYRRRISGPLLDRVDLQIEVAALAAEDLSRKTGGEPSEVVRKRVLAAHSRQMDRQGKVNAALEPRLVEHHCDVESAGWAFLSEASTRLGLSARGFHRILKVARTISDLEGHVGVGVVQIAEAIQLRRVMVA